MRILGLDYGERTIGVAVSDEKRVFAFGVEIIRRENESSIKKSIARLGEIIELYGTGTLVLGYPVKTDATASLRCEKTLEFKERLGRNFKKAEIILWDERYSTIGASRYLREANLKRSEQKEVIDKMAAVFILQGYLDSLHGK
ncbi:MAG: Holliday junction resolvase RuvX [Clostridiales bacterium]|jgi:putative Holliday junction resolvase|nr:Holliday junction resolvase RuvX [Clostridiales bacterium]